MHVRRTFLFAAVLLLAAPTVAYAQTSVTVPGSFQSALGCPGDWQPDCAITHLALDPDDQVWQGTFNVPAGAWEYKAAIDDAWDENYGANATPNGPNIHLNLGAAQDVKFYYDHKTHWITDDVNSRIAVVAGSFQSELGCAGDWDPGCLRSWLQDPDGDGVYVFRTAALPTGTYACKVAIGETWDENYGAGGVPNGDNIEFQVSGDCALIEFSFDSATNVLTVTGGTAVSQPAAVTIAGSMQDDLGCTGDWQPDCATTHLGFDPDDQVWQGTFNVPAGAWEYKAAIDDAWTENYGANAMPNGPNIGLNLAAAQDVKFYYDHETHWVTDNVNSTIAVVVGDFQSEVGCGADWDPSCLRSWLQDPDGDGLYIFSTTALPAGNYECKVAIDESWDENYGFGGIPNGANIPFHVPASCTPTIFFYQPSTHLLNVFVVEPENQPPDCSGAYASVDELWPPNHALVPVEILGVNDPDGDPVTITVTGVTQDEPLLAPGDGNTCPDAVLADGALSLRAERSGRGNGRVYVVSFTAEDGNGGVCDGSVAVCVPHDQGEPFTIAKGAAVNGIRPCGDDDPQDYDAMGTCPARGRPAVLDDAAAELPSLVAGAVRGNLATVRFTLPRAGDVELGVYDITGRRVSLVARGAHLAGAHETAWDAGSLAPGVYFYRLRSGDMVLTTPLFLRR